MRSWSLAALVSVIAYLFSASASAAPAPTVLILNSYHPQYTWTEELVRGVRDELASLPAENLHIEFMDARRMVDDDEYLRLLAAVYKYKYGRFRPDIIISSDDSALNFILERRDSIFPGIPLVFCGINSRTPEELEPVPNSTGILEGLEVAGNLELIDRLHPHAKRIVLLGDRTSLGQGMVNIARGVIPRFQRPSRKIEIWDDFTLDELSARVAAVDDGTVFLLLAIHEDRAGHYFSFSEHLKPLTARSPVPIYAMFSMLLGQGVTGGRMNDPYEHGRATAAVALRVLKGAPIDQIQVLPTAEYRPRFDYAQLQRFHISERLLPPGSVVIGRPASFYAQHTRMVWATGATFLLLVLTIAWLGSLIGRMRRAEREVLENQEELRRAQQFKLIGSLAGGIAHDFNNLITAISGFTSLAALRAPIDDELLQDNLEQVARASKRAAALTRQLLSYARRQPVEPRLIDLNTVVMEAYKLLRRLLGEAVELVVLPAPEPAWVFADPGQLEQVITNLATNARDAMPSGGTFTLAVSLDAAQVFLRATDTGMGMTDEVKARIFEPFYTTKDIGQGSGLGLATSFSIVEQAGGSISVNSAPGRETTFTVRLPRRAAGPAPISEQPRITPAQGTGTGLVLLVEDDPQVRRVAARALEQHGFEVIEAENGAIALELAKQRKGRLSCVLTDVVMPIMGGHEFVRRLRQLEPSVPVIVMSGYVDDPSLFDEARKLNVHFLAKPFLPGDLVSAVSERARPVLREVQSGPR